MQLYIFNQGRQLAGIVEAYDYFRWTRRYSRCGSFELRAIATNENLALLQVGNIVRKGKQEPQCNGLCPLAGGLTNNDDAEAGLIEFVELTGGESEFVLVIGRFATSFLSRRIVWNTEILSGDLGEAIGTLLQNNLINPSDVSRRIFGIEYVPAVLNAPVNTQITYKNLMAAVTDLCEAADMGIRTAFNPTSGLFTILPYIGSDSQAVFSREFENIIEQVFTQSIMDYATLALVAGEGEGAERVIVPVGGGEGEERHEVFVDARDLQSENFPDYEEALTFRGEQRLAELAKIETFDMTVNPHGNLTYKLDYDLGSKIQAVSKRWGVSLTARITAIEESYDHEGMQLSTTFGKPLLTITEKLRREN
jgi:hypothetical protein